jgi:hypothetical protein
MAGALLGRPASPRRPRRTAAIADPAGRAQFDALKAAAIQALEAPVERAAAVMRQGPAEQPWLFEADLRRQFRVAAILQGKGWHAADRKAEALVLSARKLAGVPAPVGFDDGEDHDIAVKARCARCGCE